MGFLRMIQRSQINICRGLFSTMPFCAWIGKIGRLGNIFSCLNLCKKEPITDFCFVERDFSFHLNINIYSRGKWDKCHPSIMNVDRETLCKYVYIYYFTDLNVAKLRRHFADIPFISFSYPPNLLIFIIHFHMIKRISGPSSYFCHEMSSWTP